MKLRDLLTRLILATTLAAAPVALPAAIAEEIDNIAFYETTVEADFADIVVFLEEAVLAEGLVVDYTGHIGDMLARTGPDVGHASPYANAQYMVFCSAKLTHGIVAASPENMAICPYSVYAYELTEAPGDIHVGYRKPIADTKPASTYALGEIDKLLRRIVDATVE